ncbi:hypothetical protein BXT84_11890 [Sulfobacillus thermotolerans]|uniref:Uncharacterized protein n=1 Tax=Sulfobacillus thermotolerans TaxID=338644 RepID=A0ABN5H1F8_9FIRM|nr:hypothetical protein BXT84_11890 [Sulfobacillus thermotolerans]
MDDNAGMSFEILAAGLEDVRHDVPMLMTVLAHKLEASLPENVRVIRQSGLFSKTSSIKSITLTFDNVRYQLSAKGGQLLPERQKIVHDVVLKTDRIPLDAWLRDVLNYLLEESRRHENARDILDRFLTS